MLIEERISISEQYLEEPILCACVIKRSKKNYIFLLEMMRNIYVAWKSHDSQCGCVSGCANYLGISFYRYSYDGLIRIARLSLVTAPANSLRLLI